ncbi:hypothetical protein QW180_20240 [Vibrio sinaloensis]|nr:hypothetical protein [Vibrio sinaloensis]
MDVEVLRQAADIKQVTGDVVIVNSTGEARKSASGRCRRTQ